LIARLIRQESYLDDISLNVICCFCSTLYDKRDWTV